MAHIIIMDDDAAVRRVLCSMLAGAGHILTEAADGAEGVELQRQHPADLTLVDLVMPRQEGLETIRELRAQWPHLKIIAMSGSITIDVPTCLKAAELLGADLSLTKPFSRQELLTAVNTLLPTGPGRETGCAG